MYEHILIIADVRDSHADVVEDLLRKRGRRVFRLNLDPQSLSDTHLSLTSGSCYLSTPSGAITSDEISVAWARRAFVDLTLEEREQEDIDRQIWRQEWNKSVLGLYLQLSRVPWVNDLPSAVRAENKYLQWRVAEEVGFLMPKTLTSNRRSDLLAFAEGAGNSVAFKLLHQDIYRYEGNVVGMYTQHLSRNQLEEFQQSNENPITIQEYITKAFEVRYTVVADQHFVCRIDSQRNSSTTVDWRRYNIPETPHSSILPPKKVEAQVRRLMTLLNLRYGALDFVVTPEGDWYFLEVNPSGQWLWIEDLVGLPISEALVDLISNLQSN